jgi:hypothetical protein
MDSKQFEALSEPLKRSCVNISVALDRCTGSFKLGENAELYASFHIILKALIDATNYTAPEVPVIDWSKTGENAIKTV